MSVTRKRATEMEAEAIVHEEGRGEGSNQELQADNEQVQALKGRRKRLRAKITRTIKRVRDSLQNSSVNQRRVQTEIDSLQRDFDLACDTNGELYDLLPDDEHLKLDDWEADLSDDVLGVREEVEDKIKALRASSKVKTGQVLRSDNTEHAVQGQQTNLGVSTRPEAETSATSNAVLEEVTFSQMRPANMDTRATFDNRQTSQSGSDSHQCVSFDHWIDELVEFKETVFTRVNHDMSVADALYRLEASKDIPTVQLNKFSGSPLGYVEFIEAFKIHIHNKCHLSDDIRMVQLRMHLTGQADRAISGLGSGGVMYATALKLLKEQFGQRSVIARAFISNLVRGTKITSSDRQGLREFSLDIINCLATL